MKAKYLFYSLALASAFTACTQDELFDAPALESNKVADRPVAGVVTFVNDDVESRYDRQNAAFENGDQMGLYLMDEFDGEPGNANNTYWDYQSAWWNMYTMVDYISTNYGYVYNSRTKEWVNHASRLVEGNYIALFPQNVLATNRRDLWYPIKSNVDLVAHTTTARKYVNRDNQFFVGYEQIKRDQEAGADGNLTAKISMKPILTYGVMEFDNNQADKIRLNKVVFTKADKSNLPNVAYVKPKGIEMTDAQAQVYMGKTWNAIQPAIWNDVLEAPYWAWSNREAMAEHVVKSRDCDGNITDLWAKSKYDRNTFTHAAARDMVKYGYASAANAPYGMNPTGEYALSREYTFNFPGAGVELAGNYEKESALTKCQISIALPAFDGWDDMKVVVYAEKWDGEKWIAGYISEKSGKEEGKTNAAWNLEDLPLWEMGQELQTVTLAIDDEYFVALNEIEVGSASDFFNLVKGRLADHNTGIPVDLTVKPYNGTTLNVNADVVNLIDAYEAKYGSDKVNITFTDGNVKLNAANSIHKFNYAGVEVELGADQEVTEEISYTEATTTTEARGISTLINSKTLTVLNKINTMVNNKGTMIVKTGVVNNKTMSGDVTTLNNNGFLTLNAGANVGTLNNNAGNETEVEAGDGSATVGTLNNNNGANVCNNCAKAVLNVTTGTLNVTELNNNAIVNVVSTLEAPTFNNYKQHEHADGVLEAIVNNNGTIKTHTMTNNGTVNNYGDITPANVDGMTGNPTLINNAVVNGHSGNIGNFANGRKNAILYVKGEELHVNVYNYSGGKIIFEGVANEHVGRTSSDERIFQTTAAIKGSEINNIMTFTKVTTLWLSHDVTIDYTDETGKTSLWSKENREAVTKVVVKAKKNVTIKPEITGKKLTLANAELDVEAEGKLTLSSAIQMTVNAFNNGDNIDVATGSSLKDASGAEWSGVNHN